MHSQQLHPRQAQKRQLCMHCSCQLPQTNKTVYQMDGKLEASTRVPMNQLHFWVCSTYTFTQNCMQHNVAGVLSAETQGYLPYVHALHKGIG